jgi:hypothetical protein
MRYLAIVIMFGFLTLGAPSSHADPCSLDNVTKQDGACWNSLSPVKKSAVVEGIWAGIRASDTNGRLLNLDGRSSYSLDHLAAPEQTTIGDIISYFDRLYETPANRDISWSYAYILAAQNARDDDQNDRLALIGFLREHKRLPSSGEIVGVKSADTITLKDGDMIFDVTLAGVRVPPETASTVKVLINAISKGTWFSEPCAKAGPTYVDLAYSDEFFDEQKRLVAYVRIPSYIDACVGPELVNFHEEGVEFTPLNFFLVRQGLALALPDSDPLWNDKRKRMREYLLSAEKGAAEKKLYVHGGSRSEIIERLTATPQNPL